MLASGRPKEVHRGNVRAASTLTAMFRQIGPGEIIIIVVVLVFLFGAKKLPELARSIGKSVKELRGGLKEGLDDTEDDEAA